MEFGTGALKQVWYEIDHPFVGNFPDQKKGWIAGKINDKNYIGTNGDPCPSVALPSEIRFPYDREAAARYAVEQGKINDTTNLPTPNQVTRNLLPLTRYSLFTYDNLNSGTGSSVFLGEVIWMGGMPMTVRTSKTVDTVCSSDVSQGWRYCADQGAGGLGSASQPWKYHSAQIAYYTNSSPDTNFQSGGAGATNKVLQDRQKGTCGGFTRSLGSELNRACSPIIQYRELGNDFDREKGMIFPDKILNFYKLFSRSGNANLIKSGDYVWINSRNDITGQADYHGLIVVGWGSVISCPDALKTPLNINTLKSQIPSDLDPKSNSDVYIPYVVDFTGAGATGLHSPTPKPFYCTMFDERDFNGSLPVPRRTRSRLGGFHSWWFFILPNTITINREQLDILYGR
jgi:hypothetical protein